MEELEARTEQLQNDLAVETDLEKKFLLLNELNLLQNELNLMQKKMFSIIIADTKKQIADKDNTIKELQVREELTKLKISGISYSYFNQNVFY